MIWPGLWTDGVRGGCLNPRLAFAGEGAAVCDRLVLLLEPEELAAVGFLIREYRDG